MEGVRENTGSTLFSGSLIKKKVDFYVEFALLKNFMKWMNDFFVLDYQIIIKKFENNKSIYFLDSFIHGLHQIIRGVAIK